MHLHGHSFRVLTPQRRPRALSPMGRHRPGLARDAVRDRLRRRQSRRLDAALPRHESSDDGSDDHPARRMSANIIQQENPKCRKAPHPFRPALALTLRPCRRWPRRSMRSSTRTRNAAAARVCRLSQANGFEVELKPTNDLDRNQRQGRDARRSRGLPHHARRGLCL